MDVQTIDLAPLIAGALQILAAILLGWIGTLVRDANARKVIGQVLEMAVRYAIEALPGLDWTRISTRNQLVALAANYAVEAAPGALRTFGITRARLEAMILARLFDHDPHRGVWEDDDDGGCDTCEDEDRRRAGRGQSSLRAKPAGAGA